MDASCITRLEVTISGKDGNDAKPYQVKDVQSALKEVKEELYGR